jgi:hypothetical protein
MIEVALVYITLAVVISFITIREDLLEKKIKDGFNPNAKDGDGDKIVQEGTKWERIIG